MTKEPNGTLKERLLEAALDALRELNPEALLHTVGARELARRAGASSPASINQHYGSLAGLAEAVVARVFDTTYLNVPRINELLTHVKDSTLPLPAAFAMHEAEFVRMTHDDEFKLRMGLWALGGDTVRDRYRDYLHQLSAQLQDSATTLFESWGRELRDPVDLDTYLALKISLINGITVRYLTDPDERHLHLFKRATVVIDLVLLRVLGDRHDLDARLTEMNYYPLEKNRTGVADRSRHTEARILRAASELFNAQGFEATGTDQIARYADTSPSTVKRFYPTKNELAVGLFRHQAAEQHLTDPDPTDSSDDLGTLGEHVQHLVEFARSRATISATYLTHLTASTSDHQTDPVIARIRQLLPDPDTDTDTDDAQDLAETLVILTVRRAITHPAESPEASARLVLARLGLTDLPTTHRQ
ncbi:MAG: helix-turn-helix domain containing protein [Propionibacteriales bacterium]|nr:helix-turn-helix domain containing protein [Propionibacteriales bacterium]